ncbi:hypothetical protein TNIN_447451 [Trichonephila inaurata madagascariensis]|uniref:Uncharacterized protein n=1 Tax=Trichonephila inaurata madagascariensis TaxID=2747483 RepID=A0A8X6JSE1_9ARAC|nr:hypothetical protein TNIN_447451 [Trichonephila inaurata madagascariensis]
MEARNIDVALVQEPHSYKGTLPGFPSSYRVFFSHSFDIIKAAIIVRNRNISTFLDLNYLDYNMVTVRLNINRTTKSRNLEINEVGGLKLSISGPSKKSDISIEVRYESDCVK